MKQVIQHYKTGKIELVETPVPFCEEGKVLVENKNSLVSIGTEKLMMDFAKKSLLGKAKERPDLVKQVINKVKTEGLMEAYKQSIARLEEPVPLGYSSAGTIREVGKNVNEFEVGNKVACAGPGYASHAEVIAVPQNLCVKIPEGVSFTEASFVALGAIALHSVRVSEAKVGENIVVIGLGLLGQITVQILRAAGCNVLGMDIDPQKLQLAKSFGINETSDSKNIIRKTKEFTQGNGADAVIIFASTKSNEPIEQAVEIARAKGKIIAPGLINLNLPRKIFYEKELELIVSRSLGPGAYDEQYEKKGIDYPISYIRWTEKRNMKAFLNLVKEKKVKLQPLITHQFKIENALSAYNMILERKEKYVGVILEYKENKEKFKKKIVLRKEKTSKKKDKINIGLIGAGLFTKGTLLPILKDIKDINLKGISATAGSSIERLSKKFNFEYITTDYKNVLKDENIDAVIITTRHNLHAKFIIEALQAGKDVFCEKPLCINENQLEEILRTYSASKNRLMIGFNRRFSPFSQFIKDEFEKNSPMVISCQVNVGFIPKESWVHNPKIGGGNIIGEVCHFVDLIQYFTNSLPERVNAYSLSSPREDTISENNIVVNLKMKNGSIANIVYNTLGNKSYSREKIEIFVGGKVGIIDNFKKAEVYKLGRKQTKKSFGVDRGHKNEYETFFKCLKENKEMPVDFKEYVITTLTTFKILESLKTGKPQRINLE